MVPAAGQGIVGVTVRADDTELRELLAAIEDPEAKAVATAERALLARLDGSCRTPIGGYARLLPDGELHLTGLVARADGSFLLKRSLHGAAARCRTHRQRTGRQPARRQPARHLCLTPPTERPDHPAGTGRQRDRRARGRTRAIGRSSPRCSRSAHARDAAAIRRTCRPSWPPAATPSRPCRRAIATCRCSPSARRPPARPRRRLRPRQQRRRRRRRARRHWSAQSCERERRPAAAGLPVATRAQALAGDLRRARLSGRPAGRLRRRSAGASLPDTARDAFAAGNLTAALFFSAETARHCVRLLRAAATARGGRDGGCAGYRPARRRGITGAPLAAHPRRRSAEPGRDAGAAAMSEPTAEPPEPAAEPPSRRRAAQPPPRRRQLLPWLTAAGFLILAAALVWVWQHPAVPPTVDRTDRGPGAAARRAGRARGPTGAAPAAADRRIWLRSVHG